MGKLQRASALVALVLIIMVSASSAYRAIITTVEIDESNQKQGKKSSDCRREIQSKDLKECMEYLRSSGSERGGGEEILELPGEENQQGRVKLERCCMELRQVRDDCQCEALDAVVERAQSGGRPEYQQVMEKAREIPSSCRLSEQCDVGRMLF